MTHDLCQMFGNGMRAMVTRHYDFTGVERTLVTGERVQQIRALKDIPGNEWTPPVPAGQVGGWIEDTVFLGPAGTPQERLSGHSWVADDGCVYGRARMDGTARVIEGAHCFGDSSVSDEAQVSGSASVSGSATIRERGRVSGNAVVEGHAEVVGLASVRDHAQLTANARIDGNCSVSDSARVEGDASLYQSARIRGHARIGGSARVGGSADVSENAAIIGSSYVGGFGVVSGDAVIDGELMIDGTYRVSGLAHIRSEQHLLVVHPLGPAASAATFYRTRSGVGELNHFFEGPWRGPLADFLVAAAAALSRLDASQDDHRLWTTQYAALAVMAAALEPRWERGA